jgi:hypothetical protein
VNPPVVAHAVSVGLVELIHRMTCDGTTSSDVVYVCDDCGRRVVVGKQQPKFVVLDRGDLLATHIGSVGGLELAVSARGH